MYGKSWLTACICLFITAFSGCRREAPLPEIPVTEATGKTEVVEAAFPEGGARGTFTVSDMTRPPTGGEIGWWPSIGTSPDGILHISYNDAYNGALHHAERKDGEWNISIVDSYGAVGKYTTLAVSPEGVPHIIYYNQDNRLLRHAMRTGPEGFDPEDRRRPPRSNKDWVFEVVDQGFEIGMAGRMLFTEDGTLHAVYYGTNHRFVHAWRKAPGPGESGRWQRRTIDEDAVGSHSIVTGFTRGRDGSLHVTYSNWKVSVSDLRYAKLPAGSEKWESSDVEGVHNAGWKSSILLDKNDNPLIIYLLLSKRTLGIARFKNDEWRHYPLVDSANTMDLVLTDNNRLILAYEHLPERGLQSAEVRYLVRSGTMGDLTENWKAYSIPDAKMATYLSVTANDKGIPAIAFYRGDIRGISVFLGKEQSE